MERTVSSSSYQFWLGPLKEITSTKTYPSSSNSVPIWQQEIGKLLESEILNNSGSIVKSDSAAKLEVSSDNHERKLQVALTKDFGLQEGEGNIRTSYTRNWRQFQHQKN